MDSKEISNISEQVLSKKKKRIFFIVIAAVIVVACIISISVVYLLSKNKKVENTPSVEQINSKYLTELGYDITSLSYEELLDIGVRYTENRKFDAAIEAYTLAIEKNSESEAAYDSLIELYEGLLADAIEKNEKDRIVGYLDALIEICEKALQNTGNNKYRETLERYTDEKKIYIIQATGKPAICRKLITRIGSTVSEYEYEYDEKGNLIREPQLNTNRGVVGWKTNFYSADGRLEKSETDFDENGIDDGDRSVEYYDDKGNVVRTESYNSKTDKTYIIEYENVYDNQNRIISRKMYTDGTMNIEYKYTYDEEGDWIIEGIPGENYNSSSHYEKQGRYFKSEIYNGDKIFCTMEGEMDQFDNIIRSTTYDSDGKEEVTFEYVYEYID